MEGPLLYCCGGHCSPYFTMIVRTNSSRYFTMIVRTNSSPKAELSS